MKIEEYDAFLRKIAISHAFVPVWIDSACILGQIGNARHIIVADRKRIRENIKIFNHVS